MISIAVSLAGSGIVERVSLLWKKFIPDKNSVGKNFIEIIDLSITSITKKCYWCYRCIDKSVKVFFKKMLLVLSINR